MKHHFLSPNTLSKPFSFSTIHHMLFSLISCSHFIYGMEVDTAELLYGGECGPESAPIAPMESIARTSRIMPKLLEDFHENGVVKVPLEKSHLLRLENLSVEERKCITDEALKLKDYLNENNYTEVFYEIDSMSTEYRQHTIEAVLKLPKEFLSQENITDLMYAMHKIHLKERQGVIDKTLKLFSDYISPENFAAILIVMRTIPSEISPLIAVTTLELVKRYNVEKKALNHILSAVSRVQPDQLSNLSEYLAKLEKVSPINLAQTILALNQVSAAKPGDIEDIIAYTNKFSKLVGPYEPHEEREILSIIIRNVSSLEKQTHREQALERCTLLAQKGRMNLSLIGAPTPEF